MLCRLVCLALAMATSVGGSLPTGTVELANGVAFPVVGFGSAGLGKNTQSAVLSAIAEGFKAVDTAQAREWYGPLRL